MAVKSTVTLPQEVWWLVSQELANRRDFGSLFNCTLISHSFASIALPLLYRFATPHLIYTYLT